MEVRHVYSNIVARGLQGISAARTCEEDEIDGPQARRLLALAAIYDRGEPHRGGEDWRRDAADHSGLGDAV